MAGRPPPRVELAGPAVALDVECVATAPDHNARAVAHIAAVGQREEVLANIFVKPEQPVASYLTPLTGLTAEKLADAAPLAEAVAALRRALPKGCILVGQNVSKDVQWLALREGEDFQGMIDLTGLFRVWNDRYRSYSVFGQDHLAGVLLGMNVGPGIAHNAEIDCIKSIRLFQYYLQIQENPEAFEKVKAALLAVPPQPSFAKLNPTFEGCCMGNRKTCTCGAPFFF